MSLILINRLERNSKRSIFLVVKHPWDYQIIPKMVGADLTKTLAGVYWDHHIVPYLTINSGRSFSSDRLTER